MISEVSYVIAGFEEKFKAFKGKKIILHGSRNYAKAIIENYDSVFHFLGIVSFDEIESDTFCGLSVYQQEDILNLQPDLIILTERVKYEEEAYCSLRRLCRQNRIPIWNMYGLDEKQLHRDAEIPAPESLKEWQEVCSHYDRVVFEAMDTLICFPFTGEEPTVKETLRSLIIWMRQQKKSIGFSLRKSFPEYKQIETLMKFGLIGNPETELIRRQGEDLSFRLLRESYPEEKILYIGNGLVNEFILPRCYGIDTRRVGERWNLSCLVPEKEESVHKPFCPDQKAQIEKEIKKHEIISFDIFDTLLVRKTLYPEDVFFLTERRAEQAGFEVKGFAALRKRAEQEKTYTNLDLIYEYLEDWYDWSEETAKKIKNIELDVERDVLAPRDEIVNLLHYALKEKKCVVLTSDMYLPAPVLQDILREKGIDGFERILVSCDYKKSKQTGLYQELIAINGRPEEILHIGDNVSADKDACEKAHIHSVLIPSAMELARDRGWDKCIRRTKTLADRCLVGMAVSELFRDPFQTPNLYERPLEERLHRYGIGAEGPLVSGFLTWLLSNLQNNNYDGVLFLARDGYLPIQIYKKLQEKMHLPRAIYYYANRHATFLCNADSEDQINYITDIGRQFGLSATEIMENVYHIPKEELLSQNMDETISDYIDRHMQVIQKTALDSREGYRQFSKNCGMNSDGKYAVVDFVAAGTTQMNLARFLPYTLKGYYFGSYKSSEKQNCDIEYYLHGSNMTFLNSFIEMEGYMTSPEPAQSCMQKEGTPEFSKETRTAQELHDFWTVFHAALRFAEDFFRIFYYEGDVIASSIVEELYAAEGYHWVQQRAFDDWLQVPIRTRGEMR